MAKNSSGPAARDDAPAELKEPVQDPTKGAPKSDVIEAESPAASGKQEYEGKLYDVLPAQTSGKPTKLYFCKAPAKGDITPALVHAVDESEAVRVFTLWSGRNGAGLTIHAIAV
jgi:hypothetical protein